MCADIYFCNVFMYLHKYAHACQPTYMYAHIQMYVCIHVCNVYVCKYIHT